MTYYIDQHILALGLSSPYRSMNPSEKRVNRLLIGIMVFAFMVDLVSLIVTVMYGSVWAFVYLVLLILGILFSLYTSFQLRPFREVGVLTQEGGDRLNEWQSFRNMLRDINSFDRVDIEGLVVWNRILVYATAFGLADKVEKYLKVNRINLPEVYDGLAIGQISTVMHTTTPHFMSSMTSASSSSTFSVSSGSGGGFSGGGGGGGGGAF